MKGEERRGPGPGMAPPPGPEPAIPPGEGPIQVEQDLEGPGSPGSYAVGVDDAAGLTTTLRHVATSSRRPTVSRIPPARTRVIPSYSWA
jgi:hypothetical protein